MAFSEYSRKAGIPLVLVTLGLVAIAVKHFEDGQDPMRAGGTTRPESIRIPGPPPARPGPETNPVVGVPIPAVRRQDRASYRSVDAFGVTSEIKASEIPGPAGPSPYGRGLGYPADPEALSEGNDSAPGSSAPPSAEPPESQAPALNRTFDSTDFQTNSTETGGYVFVPPDPHAAAGTLHLVNVANVTIRFHQKDGTLDYSDALADFFASLAPANFTFDPKVVYDQYSDRFVVVTLEVVDGGDCATNDSACTSRLLVAVSDDGDPNGVWYMTAIDAEVQDESIHYWLDYPGLAIDEEAIYVTGNLFRYSSEGGDYGGVRVWIIAKGEGSGGLYDAGGSAVYAQYDPYAGVGNAVTTQPAHVFGTPADPAIGTYLLSYSGLTDGSNEYLQAVRIDDPLSSPVFVQQYIFLGSIEANPMSPLPDAPQLGTSDTVEVNDRRALDAVWRDEALYLTSTIAPETGADAGEATAYWWMLDASVPESIVPLDEGVIGGEDIASGTSTFFPAIAVDASGNLAIGFSASAASMYPGAYYTTRAPSDPLGSTSGSALLRAGTDYYYRAFGGARNRWGDYTGAVVDPATGCFWIYNEYAMERGTPILGEDGRWATAYGEVCLDASCPSDLTIVDETYASGTHLIAATSTITVSGDTLVMDGADLTLAAGDHIGAGPGFRVEAGGVLALSIDPSPCP